MSRPAGIDSLRVLYASRVSRFSRFRLTALPHPRATTTAKRVVDPPFAL